MSTCVQLMDAAAVIDATAAPVRGGLRRGGNGDRAALARRARSDRARYSRQRRVATACVQLLDAAAALEAIAAGRKWPEHDRIGEYLSVLARWRSENAGYVRQWRAANTHDRGAEWRARRRGAFVARVEPFAVFERDQWTCGICSGPIDPGLRYPDLMSASVDHIIPLSRGGTHEPGNVQAAHFLCNSVKSAGPQPDEPFRPELYIKTISGHRDLRKRPALRLSPSAGPP